MSQSFYFKDQNVFAEDLNNTESSRIADVKQRVQNLLGSSGGIYADLYSSFSIVKGGIFGRPDEYDQNKNLRVGLSDTSTLFIYSGDAIDVDGNPIRLESTKTVELGNEDSNYIWTPTVGTNYVKLHYTQSSGSVGTDDLGNQYYSRYYDSYYIEINGTHPTGSAGNPILLAIFTGLGDGTVSTGTLFDRRLYAKVITPASGVIIDPFRNPVASQTTVEDHVAATGSGTPSITNPHGLSYVDISGEDVGLHRIQSHIDGVISYDRETSTLNSFKGTVVNNSSPTAAIDFTTPSNAVLSVGGKIISSTLDSLTGASAFSIGGNDTYAALVYKDGTTSWVLYSTFISTYYDSELGTRIDDSGVNELLTTGHTNADYYLLGICVVASGGNSLTFTDTRSFLTTHPEDIIADFKENVSDPTDDLTNTSSLEDTLNRIRYQIGIALAGTGSAWKNTESSINAKGCIFVPKAGQTVPSGSSYFVEWVEGAAADLVYNNLNLATGSTITLTSGVYIINSYLLTHNVSGVRTTDTLYGNYGGGGPRSKDDRNSIVQEAYTQNTLTISVTTSSSVRSLLQTDVNADIDEGRLSIIKIS